MQLDYGLCNTPTFVTNFKYCLVRQKWGPTKTFCANLWKCCFLPVCLGCCIKNVYLSCLLNDFVNQENPCALVIMSSQIPLAILQNRYLGNPSYFKWFDFIQKPIVKIYFDTKVFPIYLFIKHMGIYRLVWSHYFLPTTILQIIWWKDFQTPLWKHAKGDTYVSTCF
jgi:hypothetical protein